MDMVFQTQPLLSLLLPLGALVALVCAKKWNVVWVRTRVVFALGRKALWIYILTTQNPVMVCSQS